VFDRVMRILAQGCLFAILKYVSIRQRRYIITGDEFLITESYWLTLKCLMATIFSIALLISHWIKLFGIKSEIEN